MSSKKKPSVSKIDGEIGDENIEDIDPEDIVSTDNDDLNEAFGFNEAGEIDDEAEDEEKGIRPMIRAEDIFGEWDDAPLRSSRKVELKHIGRFDARGMRHVYGRGDDYGRGHVVNMDVWLTKDGRLLARFWSRSVLFDFVSLEVIGFSPKLPMPKSGDLDERWVPKRLREEYSVWIYAESDYT